MTVRLREMTAAEMIPYAAGVEREYARELHESTGGTLEQAQQDARRTMAGLLPDGVAAPGEQVWVAVDQAGARVGVLWLARRQVGTPTEHVWIYDIEVDPEHRGRGVGRELLTLAEEQTRAWGQTSLQLNVFGANDVARRLYQTQGFAEVKVTMAKRV